jgi:hypothetical protein
MSQDVISILGRAEAVEAISKQISMQDVTMDPPEPADSLTDALDAPLGPQEIQQVLQFLTVMFGTASSMLLFFDRLISLLKTIEGDQELKLVNPRNGKALGVVRADSKAEEIVKLLT